MKAFVAFCLLALCSCSVPAEVSGAITPECPVTDAFLVVYAKNLQGSREILVGLENADLAKATTNDQRYAVQQHYLAAWFAYRDAASAWLDTFNSEPMLVDEAHRRVLSGLWQSFQASVDATQPPAR